MGQLEDDLDVGARAATPEERRRHRTPFAGWAGMPPPKHRTEYMDAVGKPHESPLAAFMSSTKYHLMQWIDTYVATPNGKMARSAEGIAGDILEGREEIIAILTPPRDHGQDSTAARKFADDAGTPAPPPPPKVENRRVLRADEFDEDEEHDDLPERIYDRADVIAAFEAGIKHGAMIRPFPSKVLK